MKTILHPLWTAIIPVCLTSVLSADDVSVTLVEAEWTGANGQFDEPGNWSTGEVPTANRDVFFGPQGLDSTFWDSSLREVRNIRSSRAGDFFVGGNGATLKAEDIRVTAGTLWILPTLTHDAMRQYNVSQSATLDISGGIAGSNLVLKYGAGDLVLRNNIQAPQTVYEGTSILQNGSFNGEAIGIVALSQIPSVFRVGNNGIINGAGIIPVNLLTEPNTSATLEITGNTQPGVLNINSLSGGGDGTNTLRFNHTSDNYYFTRTGNPGGLPVLITPSSNLNVNAQRGTTTLLADYSHTGTHSVGSDGILRFGNGAQAGVLNGPISNNGQLVFHRSNAMIFSHPITGNGQILFLGPGQYSLDGSSPSSYLGTTTVDGARLRVADNNLLGNNSSSVVIVNEGTLQNLSSNLFLHPHRDILLAGG